MRFLLFICLITVLISCQTKEATDDSLFSGEQVSHENNFDQKPDYTGYELSKKRLRQFKQPNITNVQDEYSTKRARQLAEHLNAMDEINRSQVVETDDKIIAGVILNLHADKQLGDTIEKEIRKFTNDEKEIIVYTDYTYWYKRIDEDASARATRIGEDLEVIFDQFFDIAD